MRWLGRRIFTGRGANVSHIETMNIVVRDLDAFEAACESCGCELRRNVAKFNAYSGGNDCAHAIVARGKPDAYQMGLRRARILSNGDVEANPNGDVYVIAFDEYRRGKGMVDLVGDQCGRLLQAYGRESVLRQAAKLGGTVQETKLPDGSVRMVITPRQATVAAQVQQGW